MQAKKLKNTLPDSSFDNAPPEPTGSPSTHTDKNPFAFQSFKIDKYQVIEKIAVGGMGEVYRGKLLGAENFSKHLAIKRINPSCFSDPESKKNLISEAKISSQINHPNVVQTFDLVQSNDELLLVMEFVPGKTLRQVQTQLATGGLLIPTAYALYIVSEVAEGMHAAHTHKNRKGEISPIIHRDISPQNIMIGYNGAVKILDFGVAKSSESGGESTKAGLVKGKVSYMAPEQAWGKPINGQADIFALGLVLYELLTGEKVRSSKNDIELLVLAQSGTVPPVPKDAEVPAALEKVMLKALAPDLNARYQSAEDFSTDLKKLLNDLFPDFSVKEIVEFMEENFAFEMKQLHERMEATVDVKLDTLPIEKEGVLVPVQEFSRVGFLSNSANEVPVPVQSKNTNINALANVPLELLDERKTVHRPEVRESVVASTTAEVFDTSLKKKGAISSRYNLEFKDEEPRKVSPLPILLVAAALGIAGFLIYKKMNPASFPMANAKLVTSNPVVPINKTFETHVETAVEAPLLNNQARVFLIAVGDKEDGSYAAEWSDAFSKVGTISPCEGAESDCKGVVLDGQPPYTINIHPKRLVTETLWSSETCLSISPNASFDKATQNCRFSLSSGEFKLRFFK